jgi:hypothetical protein
MRVCEGAGAAAPTGTGHVFVVRGTLEQLLADDVLVSTDMHGTVEEHFFNALGWDTGKPRPVGETPTFRADHRVHELPAIGEGPRRWLVAVGADCGESVSWLLDGVRQALRAAATAGHGQMSKGVRPRIAMPVMGVGRGGYDSQRGEVINGLLDVAERVAAEHGVDVVLVAFRLSDYSALQSIRRGRPDSPLSVEQETSVEELAEHARQGRLALFMGAGTGIPAGLPSWSQLLAKLAKRLRLRERDGLDKLNPLDAADLLRRAAKRPRDERGRNRLGEMVAKEIGDPTRYALSHVLLAALEVEQAITTNFDQLYELAVAAVGGDRPLVVLPSSTTDDLAAIQSSAGWLLKLHGDVKDAASIVLDRRSFVRYDATRRPLGGVLQTTLLTKHLLVVGASMTDDNVIRLVHEVSALHEEGGQVPRRLGTVLALSHQPLHQDLWSPEFKTVELGADPGSLTVAGRELEIFLDRLALLTAPTHTHLLDPRYRELLSAPAEKELADELERLMTTLVRLSFKTSTAPWDRLADALSEFGAIRPDRPRP